MRRKYLIELNLLKMGKNNKNNKKKQVEPTKAEQTTYETATTTDPEVKQTPEERHAEYAIQQQSQFDLVLDGFKADDLMLVSEADFSLKMAELEKLKQTELKKFEKSNKNIVLEFNDLFAQCNNEK